MKLKLKGYTAELILVGVVVGASAGERLHYWLSWRRVRRELRRLEVGEL